VRLKVGDTVYCKVQKEWGEITGYHPALGDLYTVSFQKNKFPSFGEYLMTVEEFDIKNGRYINGKPAIRSNINTNGCSHKWIDYQGFTDSYRFCTKCDQKEKS